MGRRQFAACGIAIVLDTLAPLAVVVLPKFIIDELMAGGTWQAVLRYIGIFIGVMLAIRIARLAFSVFTNMAINGADAQTGRHYAGMVMALDYAQLENSHVRDLEQKVRYNVRPGSLISECVQPMVTGLLQVAGYAYILFTLHPLVLLGIALVLVANYAIGHKREHITFESQGQLAQNTRKFEYLFASMADFRFAKDIRINHASGLLTEKFDNLAQTHWHFYAGLQNKQLILSTLALLTDMAQLALMYGYCAWQAIAGNIGITAEENCVDWLYNSFIQTTGNHYLYVDYYDFYYRNCPLLDYQRINADLIIKSSCDFLNFIISAIEQGYFLYFPINPNYISAYEGSFVNNPLHQIFIYGYDNEQMILHICDTFVNGVYTDRICTYYELVEAYNNRVDEAYSHWDFRNCLELVKLVSDANFGLEPTRIRNSISDYLMCVPTKRWYVQGEKWQDIVADDRCYGLDCYDILDKHLQFCQENHFLQKGAIPSFHLMWQHKVIMKKRIERLQEKGYLSDCKKFLDEYDELIQLSRVMLNTIVKYNFTGKEGLLLSAQEKCAIMVEKENDCLRKILCDF